MTKRLLGGLYFALWAAILAGLVNFAVRSGYSIFPSLFSAFLTFQIVNGTLAYIGRLRRLEPDEKLGQSYFRYLFFPRGLKYTFEVPRLLRQVLGLPIMCGGICFLLLGIYFLTLLLSLTGTRALIVAACVLMLGAVGTAISYVGLRLLVVKNGERLFPQKQTNAPEDHHAA